MSPKTDGLERVYCPPLDTATFYAIVSDFDLDDQASLKSAVEILEALKASADAADTTGFDPSGSSHPKDGNAGGGSTVFSGSEDGGLMSKSSTSITDALSSLDAFTFDEETTYDKGIDAMNDDETKALLREMFSMLKPVDVDFAFRKHRGTFATIVEDLLSQQFLQEEAVAAGNASGMPRSIDGFASIGTNLRKTKGKYKRRGKNSTNVTALDAELVEKPMSSANRWQKGHDDVLLITSRTNLKETLVRSLYNSSGHSVRATLFEICNKSPSKDLGCNTDVEDTLVQSSIVELAHEFPSVPVSCLQTLVLLTHPLFVNARALAEVLSQAPGELLVPKYAATKLSDTGTHTETLEDDSTFLGASVELPVGSSYSMLRSKAFAQASAAYRKSRSSPYMGGAAAYYASVGHAANAAMKRERALDANTQVARQSGEDYCDLHGVTVQDATRIAKQYVQRWWEARQEWAREGKVMGRNEYRVVVGRGSHSAEKRGRLGPAVAAVLEAEGWQIDVQVGEIFVRGKVRK